MSNIPDLVRDALKQVLDPEAGLNVVDLGLIYDIVERDGVVVVTMTFTSEGCPLGPMLADMARRAVTAVPGVREVLIDITFEPRWTPDAITPDGRALLGW